MIDFDRLQKIFDVSVSQTAESSADSKLDPIEGVIYAYLDYSYR